MPPDWSILHSTIDLPMAVKKLRVTSPKTNMDTQNDGLEKVDPFKIWPFLVSMLDFWGVYLMTQELWLNC